MFRLDASIGVVLVALQLTVTWNKAWLIGKETIRKSLWLKLSSPKRQDEIRCWQGKAHLEKGDY